MQITLSKLGLGLLASVSVTALVAGSAHANQRLLEIHGYMDHGKLVAVKVIDHDTHVNPKKPPTYTYDYTLSYAATITAAKTPTVVVGWGLYDPSTCMGTSAGKSKKPAASVYGKWSTSVTTTSSLTTSYCPSGITNFSSSNVLFSVKSAKVASGTVVTGTSVWTAKSTSTTCPMATTPKCVDSYTITDPLTVTYTP